MVPEATSAFVRVANETEHGFSPLSTVLGAISAVYTDHKVRLRSPAQNCPLTNPSVGIRRHQKQDRNPHLIRRRTGGTF